MFSYIAAIAVAATVMISPTPVKAEAQQRSAALWTPQASLVRINKGAPMVSVAVAEGQAVYLLNTDEQAVFRRALLRSVRILD